MSAKNIRQLKDRDPLLSRVRNLALQGWHDVEDKEIPPFNRRKQELSMQDGCVLWGSRVVVPQAGRAKVLEELHDGHPGVQNEEPSQRSCVVTRD